MTTTYLFCHMALVYGIFDSRCPHLQLSPYENKIGGYPVSLYN